MPPARSPGPARCGSAAPREPVQTAQARMSWAPARARASPSRRSARGHPADAHLSQLRAGSGGQGRAVNLAVGIDGRRLADAMLIAGDAVAVPIRGGLPWALMVPCLVSSLGSGGPSLHLDAALADPCGLGHRQGHRREAARWAPCAGGGRHGLRGRHHGGHCRPPRGAVPALPGYQEGDRDLAALQRLAAPHPAGWCRRAMAAPAMGAPRQASPGWRNRSPCHVHVVDCMGCEGGTAAAGAGRHAALVPRSPATRRAIAVGRRFGGWLRRARPLRAAGRCRGRPWQCGGMHRRGGETGRRATYGWWMAWTAMAAPRRPVQTATRRCSRAARLPGGRSRSGGASGTCGAGPTVPRSVASCRGAMPAPVVAARWQALPG